MLQKHSGLDVGSSSQKNAYRPSKEHLDSAGDCRKKDSVLKFCEDVCEHVNQCKVEYELKVSERVELERKVKGMLSFTHSPFCSFWEDLVMSVDVLRFVNSSVTTR